MPGFDRSKLKATSMAVLEAQEKEQEVKRPTSGGNFDRNYLTVENGDNKFRIFPAHPDGGGQSFAEAKCVSFLSVRTAVKDDKGQPTGEYEIKRRPVFNAKVHGNLPKDLVEEYLRVAKKIAIPEFTEDAEEQKKIWNKIVGMEGVKPIDTWAVYAAKIEGETWNLGLLELKKSMKSQLTERALEFTSGDVQSPDPYSDPDDGVCIIINKSGQKLDTEYKVSLETRKAGKFNTEYVPTPIPDEVLEQWAKLKPLHETYVDVFTRKDFELQLDGLQRFDQELAKQKYPIRVFERPEFLAVVDELLELVPEPTEQGEEGEEEAKPTPKKVAPKLSNGAAKVKAATNHSKQVDQEDPAPTRRPVAKKIVEVEPQDEVDDEPIGEVEEEVQVPQQESIADRIKRIKEKAGIK